MPNNQLGMIPGRGCAVARLGDALLRALGGTQVTLRLSDPSSGDTSSQLGLEAPPAEDLQISPAVVRALEPGNGRRRIEAVVSATALRTIAKDYGVQDLGAWLLGMQGVLQCDQVWRIAEVLVDRFVDTECLYHLIATE